MERQDVLKIVLEAVSEVGEDQENEVLLNPHESTRLYGGAKGNLDSVGVVVLITELEEKIAEKFEVDIVLADDRAMSQKTSPFRSVKTLTNYIVILLKEAKEKG